MFLDTNYYRAYQSIFEDLLDNFREIQKETTDLISNEKRIPWHEKFLYNGEWSVIPIVWQRQFIDAPSITKDLLLKHSDIVVNAGFSIIDPGCYIKPHVGYTDEVLRCHLGIDCPESDCFIEVSGERRSWKNGEILLFDDTKEHFVRNDSDRRRVILLIDLLK